MTGQTHYPTLWNLLERQASDTPRKDFLRTPDCAIDYGSASALVDRFAAGLQERGIRPGDRVALVMSNSIEQVLVWLATIRVGGIHVPLNAGLSMELLARSLRQVKPKFVITDAEFVELTENALQEAGSDPISVFVYSDGPYKKRKSTLDIEPLSALEGSYAPTQCVVDQLATATLLFTSGSTGVPKACALSHRYLVRAGEIHCRYLDLASTDVLFTPFPLFHIDAATLTVGAALAIGGTAALSSRFSASRFWSEVRACEATVFNFMGATANILWKQAPTKDDKNHKVRLAWGVPMPTCEPRWQARFGFPLIEVYGMTDAGLPAYQPLDLPRRAGSCGRVIPEYEICIADSEGHSLPAGQAGEILIRSHEEGLIMNEYFEMPEATQKALRGGWFHTGDIGQLDSEGYLYFHSRGSEVIRRRGENIAATDVENALNQHPLVQETAAVGVPSELSEDDIKVFIALQEGAIVDPAALVEYCRAELPKYMIPRYVEITKNLPKTATQKIDRRSLSLRPMTSNTWDAEIDN
ncbi:AMP-binding protein [Sulfitobacter sp. NFXS29]|uniref:AMP-binding protein n=1 Tax=Sulfitobacter sp. NFXS29 TaxID=2818438 RepID=UPI0032DF5287